MTLRSSNYVLIAASLVLVSSAQAAGPRPVRPAKSDPTACLKSSETAQSLENAGKLLEASAAFTECAQTKCPEVVASDCSTALERLKSRIPTLSLRVQNSAHQDILGARLKLDGVSQPDALKGTPVPVNPGKHVLKVEADGYTEDTRDVLVATGEQARVIAIVLARPDESIPIPGKPSSGGAGAGPWVVMGVGGAGMAVGAVLWATSPALPASCNGSSCAPADVEAAQKHDDAATLGLRVLASGALVTAGGLVWYLASPTGSDQASLRLEPSLQMGGGFSGLRAVGRF